MFMIEISHFPHLLTQKASGTGIIDHTTLFRPLILLDLLLMHVCMDGGKTNEAA
jgi:hypothetical protein